LTPEQVQRIEAASPFSPGFPNSLIVSAALIIFIYNRSLTTFTCQGDGTSVTFMLTTSGHFDRVPLQQPVTPAK
jgi:hypothetical protein